jgi:hypothetical protein
MKLINWIRTFFERLKSIKVDVYIGLTSLIVSIIALIHSSNVSKEAAEINKKSVELSKEMRDQTVKHNKLSVLPVLSLSSNFDANDPIFDFIGVQLENRGIGPALFAPPLIIYKGKFLD